MDKSTKNVSTVWPEGEGCKNELEPKLQEIS